MIQLTQSHIKAKLKHSLDGFFVDTKDEEVKLLGVYLNDVIEYIRERPDFFGFEVGDFESNGWQWDFWQPFKLNGESFMLSGSGYYGKLTIKRISE